MRSTMTLVTILVLTLGLTLASQGPITSNPIPAPVAKRGLAVQIKDLVRLPAASRAGIASLGVTLRFADPAAFARLVETGLARC